MAKSENYTLLKPGANLEDRRKAVISLFEKIKGRECTPEELEELEVALKKDFSESQESS